jgi:hypothetical protein
MKIMYGYWNKNIFVYSKIFTETKVLYANSGHQFKIHFLRVCRSNQEYLRHGLGTMMLSHFQSIPCCP